MNFNLLGEYIVSHLNSKVPSTEIVGYLSSNPTEVNQIIADLDRCVIAFNKFRILNKFPNKNFYKNSHELDRIFRRDLPKFKTIFDKLSSNNFLIDQIFHNLAIDGYLVKIWQVRPIKLLFTNILLLIYRNTILTLNKDLLIDNQGHRRVQISSVIEEMTYYHYLLGERLSTYDAFALWLEDWQEEGFTQELYLAVKNNINILP